METLKFVLLFVLVLASPQYSQTQLLKVGNATGFGAYPYGSVSADITFEKATINGNEYFKRKLGWTDPLSDYTISYERIIGDSAYYALSTSGTDSLAFNFNWPVGKVFYSYTVGNTVYEKKISNISIGSILIPQDTLYSIIFYSINLATGDTTYGYGVYFGTTHSKKLGKTDEGIFISLQGAKIDGVRYGDIMPYPEEVIFSEDSLYSNFIGDTVKCYIKNTSEYDVVLDSIYTSGIFPYGYLMYLIKGNDYFFINLFNNYPNHPLDTLNYIIPAHDSILLQIYDIDLCAICKKQPNEYFEDTLRFVFSFMDGNIYSFSRSIPISGEGHPSAVEDDESLPKEFSLSQNYPNPFNPSTKISWQSPVSSWQTLKVYDVLGNEISTLVNEYRSAGNYEVNFSVGRDSSPALASGVYYYQLKTGSFVETKKMILIK